MKVSIKLTALELRTFINWFLKSKIQVPQIQLSELQILNLQLFQKVAAIKLIGLYSDFGMYDKKLRRFSIDINQYCACMAILELERDNLEPLMLAIFITIQNQNRNVLHLS